MVKRLLVVGMVLMASVVLAQDMVKGPVITWEKLSHEFGDIVQGEKIEHTFKFTNTGTAALIITNVEVTCGCTVPKGWPRDPIMPGSKGEITIAFNSSGKIGRQNKVATVTSNSIGTTNQVMIVANVLDKKL
ncbi:MAG TPA: DUF1573 domain-containing protein [Cyclobacteriaceae bacterium]|jgi:hypothetical protein|nr:DUF1573 domain-containing protein [Cytophagales bacterium]HMR57646.1 DUF1573 domain-containing protein [Cyclobacteriaceae bacterium]HRE66713.1 DUF1573 domain-containing protein [Cyclobacteriaceae bacterium]HRF33527.1 DUF1573 domain-containing protein [Cyclobacteriaceae bacterium]